MKLFEFKEIMERFNYYKNLNARKNIYCGCNSSYYSNLVTIYFNDCDYAVVSGKIPFQVIKNILEKNPTFQNSIKVGMTKFSWKQTVDILSSSVLKDNFGYLNEKYFPALYIDTKETLVMLLTELNRYYADRGVLDEPIGVSYEELMSSINLSLLEKINPIYSFNDLLSSRAYLMNDHEGMENIGIKLLQFDKAVNPFTNYFRSISSVGEFKDNVSFSVDVRDLPRYGETERNVSLTIIDDNTNNSVTYFRGNNRLLYQIEYNIEEGQTMMVAHYYTLRSQNGIENGEMIGIQLYGDRVSEPVNIRYNLSQGVAIVNNQKVSQITESQAAYIVNTLLNATKYASEITGKKDETKSFTRVLK